MSFLRMLAVVGVFLLACGGWAVLGTTTLVRSNLFSAAMGEDVEALYGGRIVQEAPELSVAIPGTEQSRRLMPSASRIGVTLDLDHRQRGLVWLPTFRCDFAGTYSVKNEENAAQKVRLNFKFPSARGTYDNFSFSLGDADRKVPVDTASGLRDIIELAPGETKSFTVTYRTWGMREWRYRPAVGTGRVRDLKMDVTTNFAAVDYPEGARSPTAPAERTGEGTHIAWDATDLITTQDMGVIMPEKINPGPLSARLTFFAPVCLFFFFVLFATISIVRRVNIHPMHYLFVAAGFFAFHLLFAYSVDVWPVHAAFAVAAVVAVTLVTLYLRAALGAAFPWKLAAAGQIFYLVLFSYSFFLKGITGLTVTVGSILTLALLMWVTAKIDWFDYFSLRRRAKELVGRVTG
jgi:hypothetical protein